MSGFQRPGVCLTFAFGNWQTLGTTALLTDRKRLIQGCPFRRFECTCSVCSSHRPGRMGLMYPIFWPGCRHRGSAPLTPGFHRWPVSLPAPRPLPASVPCRGFGWQRHQPLVSELTRLPSAHVDWPLYAPVRPPPLAADHSPLVVPRCRASRLNPVYCRRRRPQSPFHWHSSAGH